MLMRAITNYVALGHEPSPTMLRMYHAVKARQVTI
jgi:hypothetical protein